MVCTDAEGNVSLANVEVVVETFLDTDEDGIGDDTDTDDDNDGVLDDDDAVPTDPLESVDTDQDGIGDNADLDDDGDGTADNNDTFPLDPTETVDTDSDGIGDTADADDDNDGEVDASVNPQGPFTSGNHELEWTAVDAAGNVAIEIQILKVQPMVSVSPNQESGEGNIVETKLLLSGEAPDYPVVVSYSRSGTADDDDVNGLTGSAEITIGITGSIDYEIIADGEAEDDESLTLELTGAEGAVLGSPIVHTVTITEQNLSPRGSMALTQAGDQRSQVSQQEGEVTVVVEASDANPGDALSYDWSGTSGALVLSATDEAETSFDPASVAPGNYLLSVSVSDDADPPAVINLRRLVRVVEEVGELSDTDTDGDGIADDEEGYNDTDGDGIEDYRDNNADV